MRDVIIISKITSIIFYVKGVEWLTNPLSILLLATNENIYSLITYW